MATSIEINNKTVKELLESGKYKKFIIPDYQRPYAWTKDQIQTLFDDLVEYTEKKSENKDESNYFLGTIVTFENENNEQEIIDGQQRITSLFLLLRAIYSKLSSMFDTEESRNFKSQIEPVLWTKDKITGRIDYNDTLISSRVNGDKASSIFNNILITGEIIPKEKDNYTLNYCLFVDLVEDYCTSQPELFFWLIENVLNQAIFLPITADSQDTALTIFSTLNDRGLALSDSDIFKAKIYNNLESNEKDRFINEWKSLDEEATNVRESIYKLFYYYMFYLRALEDDRNSTTPGLRKYYSENNFERLYSCVLMKDLNRILNLWYIINNRIEIEENWSKNIKIVQTLDCLASYPNEFWKYPVVIYYLKYSHEENFETYFLSFLRRLTSELLARYLINPTINSVKGKILDLNAEIIQSTIPKFNFNIIEEKELKNNIKTPHIKTIRMILKILSYEHQDELLPENWEIEHILPTHWQDSYFPNDTEENVKDLVEHIGNKIPFEKKLNIKASDGYFKQKQKHYNDSKVIIVNDLSHSNEKWGLDEIRERDIRITDQLYDLLCKWGLNDQ